MVCVCVCADILERALESTGYLPGVCPAFVQDLVTEEVRKLNSSRVAAEFPGIGDNGCGVVDSAFECGVSPPCSVVRFR